MKRSPALLVFLVFAVLGLSRRAEATPIVDVLVNQPSGGISRGSSGLLGQTFTVGITGTLTEVAFELFLLFPGTPPATLAVSLYSTVAGVPSTLLQSSTLSTSGITSSGAFMGASFSYPVTAGDVLAAFLAGTIPPSGTGVSMQSGPNVYSGGVLIQNLVNVTPNEDFSIRTLVEPTATVPEPATLSLLGLGLAGVVARRRMKRR